ncbi:MULTISPECIES: class I SAM-dependent methyltransferase [Methylomicrobium]|uniref:Methylase involved in ubiquinone/menaquinone biosynthesis n=1 Tax=Methylomicrobium album BG8 TaxID=686340 RepID=H8GP80_METAL|nr:MULTISPECIES: class I SAM-dependent methyltransferase [Methylomicrobium]EIC29666.1 methylase involved in ubiquinone/menaquinone biosynthesis [Methylomicrobium album BG8]
MDRQPEPELMEDPEQVRAYAEADFAVPHQQFVDRLRAFVGDPEFSGIALDLGCGPCDIGLCFAKAFPRCRIDAVDGSRAMLDYAAIRTPSIGNRIRLIHERLPFVIFPEQFYAIIFSNSLLHHLPDPQALWQTIKKAARPGTRIAVMDLLRPASLEAAMALVEAHAAGEPEILRRDFYRSLLAAFTLEEIRDQLKKAELPLNIEPISDRHVFIEGVMP